MVEKRKETIEFSMSLKFNVEFDEDKFSAAEVIDTLESNVLKVLAESDFTHVESVHADMRPVSEKNGWFRIKLGKLGRLGQFGKSLDAFAAKRAPDAG